MCAWGRRDSLLSPNNVIGLPCSGVVLLYLLSEVLLESWCFSSGLKTLPILLMLLLFSFQWVSVACVTCPLLQTKSQIFPALERAWIWTLKRASQTEGASYSWDIRTRSNFRDYLIDLFFFFFFSSKKKPIQPFSSKVRPIALSQHSFRNCVFLFLPMRSISLLDKDI